MFRRGWPEQRRQQLVVIRPVGDVLFTIDIEDQDLMTPRVIGPDRRDVRPIPVTRENALIEVGQHDILRRPFID